MKLPEELQFIANARMVQKTTSARMDGRTCVITGATSGVGYQSAKHLAQGGAHLIIVCRNCEKAARVKHELGNAYGARVDCFQADFSKRRHPTSALAPRLSELAVHPQMGKGLAG